MTDETAGRNSAAPARRGLDPKVWLGLAGIFLFFVASGVVAYRNVRTLRDDNQLIIHSENLMSALQGVLTTEQDAETGQRGFLLTNNERYLEPYNTAAASIASRLDDIRKLTEDNSRQQSRLVSLDQHIGAKMAELKETVDLRRSKGFDAALAVVTTDRGKGEMDAIRTIISAMVQEEEDLRDKRVAEMTDSFNRAVASGVLSALLGITLVVIVGYLIRRATLARQRLEWLQSGQVGLAAAMLGDQRQEQLGEAILQFLARYLDAHAGAVFVGDGNKFRCIATYGAPAKGAVPEQFERGNGLLGRAAVENRSFVIREVPEGYLTVASGLGQSTPRHLVISPASADKTVNAVVELGFIHPLAEDALTLIDQMADAIGTAVRSANYRAELQNMLEETQRQAEELQAQGEELRVSNEELEEQSRALREQQSRLEQQQAELEQTNAHLEEQAQQLELQRDDLERSNEVVQLKARELEQASRYKSDFLANMSHELRTPLNSSLILAKLLADNPNDNLTAEQVKFAQTIQASGNDLLTLINDILDLSKIEAGHMEIRSEPMAVKGFAEDIRRLFDPIAAQKGLQFEIEIGPECPISIDTDRQRLEQVVKNLLSNAFKFTEQGRVELTIKRAADQQIAIAVADTGIGIPEEQQHSVFEAFRQADGTISRRYGGTGLGLSISRELVRLLGGSLRLKSLPSQGSTFTIVIPETYSAAVVRPRQPEPPVEALVPLRLPASPQAPAPARVQKVEDDRETPSDGKRALLIVEDDDTFARILRDVSREMGFQCFVASNATEAMTIARRHIPHAIILDVGLPDYSGLSVLDQLKRDTQTRHIPIHVVSAGDHAETALALGAVGYMVKPVKREDLSEVVRKLEARLSQRMHRVLIVEDDAVQREAVAKLLSSPDVETVVAGTAAECLQRLKDEIFDCMVLDLSLPDASGYALLETLSRESAYAFPPVIVYTGRDLSSDEEQRLRRYSKSIIIKGAKSPERLLDEVTLFLHQVISELPLEQQKMIRKARNRDALLEGRRVLIVEDDVRNVYALTNILEPRGVVVEIARNGQEALDMLETLAAAPATAIDLVLMDVMMPVMDGLTATRKIRQNASLQKLPVIMLTAKAMQDDQERCLAAGANDYMAKPLDIEKLLSLVRVWMPR